jgi:hypothetical protein
MFSDTGPVCSGNLPQFAWDNTLFRLSVTANPGTLADDGIGFDLIGGNNSRGGAQRIRQSVGGGSLRFGYADGNTQSYISSLDPVNVPNHLALNYGGGVVSVGTDLETFVAQPAYGALLVDPGGGSRYGYVFGTGGDFRGGVYYDASGPPHVELRGYDTGVIERFRISANSATTSFVPGEFQAGGTLSCNGTNSAIQTNASGKFVCGSITGGGGGVTSVGLSVPSSSIFGVTGSPITTTGTLGLTTTGTSGGTPYFSSSTQLASSGALTQHAPVLGGGAGGAPVTTAALTNGQLLIGSTGADPVPASLSAGSNITITPSAGGISIAAASGTPGAMTLVSTQTASSSATLDFTGLTGKKYLLIGRILQPATNSVEAWIRIGTGGGPTFSTSNYRWSARYSGSTGTVGVTNNNSDAKFNLAGAIPNSGGSTSLGVSFTMYIDTDNSTFTTLMGDVIQDNTDTITYSSMFAGRWTNAAAITGIRFMFSSGNVTSGSVSLYALSE